MSNEKKSSKNNGSVSIVGLNKADVLLALYNNAKFGGEGFKSQPQMQILVMMSGNGTMEAAKKLINNGTYNFDYVDLGAGPRPLKVNLSGFEFNSFCYATFFSIELSFCKPFTIFSFFKFVFFRLF